MKFYKEHCCIRLLGVFRIFVFVLLFCCTNFDVNAVIPIDAKNNAVYHNNVGINYMREGDVYAAITSFKIALGLNPASSASSTIYNNLGNAYTAVGCYKLAEECFVAAIKFSPMTFTYYQNLVNSYKKQNILEKKLFTEKKIENNTENILNALIYIELGDVYLGYLLLDNFVKKEPNLIITNGIKEYLNNLPQDL